MWCCCCSIWDWRRSKKKSNKWNDNLSQWLIKCCSCFKHSIQDLVISPTAVSLSTLLAHFICHLFSLLTRRMLIKKSVFFEETRLLKLKSARLAEFLNILSSLLLRYPQLHIFIRSLAYTTAHRLNDKDPLEIGNVSLLSSHPARSFASRHRRDLTQFSVFFPLSCFIASSSDEINCAHDITMSTASRAARRHST